MPARRVLFQLTYIPGPQFLSECPLHAQGALVNNGCIRCSDRANHPSRNQRGGRSWLLFCAICAKSLFQECGPGVPKPGRVFPVLIALSVAAPPATAPQAVQPKPAANSAPCCLGAAGAANRSHKPTGDPHRLAVDSVSCCYALAEARRLAAVDTPISSPFKSSP